jgi:hypothetical protein
MVIRIRLLGLLASVGLVCGAATAVHGILTHDLIRVVGGGLGFIAIILCEVVSEVAAIRRLLEQRAADTRDGAP